MEKTQHVSVVVPVYNEEENVDLLYQRLTEAMEKQSRAFEIIIVDDGSSDQTLPRLETIAKDDARIKLVQFRRNFGQTAAMQAGIDHANGDVVITIDGDLQNEPDDIPMMLDKIDEGYDLVHGWRKKRNDAFINRKLPSKIANWLISKTSGFPIHDLGCTLKAIRTEVAKELELYGEMHRFIPILAHARGAKCVEVETRHHARQFGTTKYGIGRTFRVILDLITVQYMLRWFASPMKLFGKIGLLAAMTCMVSVLATIGMKWIGNVDMTGNPLLLLSAISGIASIQFFSLGLIGEVNSRIYFQDNRRRNYTVRSTTNFDDAQQDNILPSKRAA